jgi:Tfp pilus assembly protein PilF
LSEVAIEDQNYVTAQRHLEHVLRLEPDNPAGLNNLAWVLATQQKVGAVELAERANHIRPNHPTSLTLSHSHLPEGKAATALEIVRNAVQQNPDANGLRLRLARLYLQTGDKALARIELRSTGGTRRWSSRSRLKFAL